MYISDVIGQIRARLSELQKQVHELKLAVYLLENGAARPGRAVSRETDTDPEGDSDGDQPTLF